MTLELGKSGIPLGAYEEGTGSGGGGGASELDQYLSGSTNASTTTLTVKNGKALDISAPTIAVGDNLVNNINGENTQLYLKQGDIESGDNITVEQTSTGVKVSATGSAAPTNMVTTDTTQTITGSKTFKHGNGISVTGTSSNSNAIKVDGDDKTIIFNSINTTDAVIKNTGYTATKLKIGENFERVQITTNLYDKDGTLITGGSGGSGSVEEKYGIEGDYATHYGIVDNPNGVIDYNISNKDIVVQQGLVLKCAGNGTAKSIIANNMPYTVTSTGAVTLFYANGNILECGKVDYSLTEPTDNGTDNYQAWFNPDKTANPNQQWQFKSNDTGNVFRPVNSATPFADIVAGETGITSVSYIGYRVIDDDVFAQQSDIEDLEDKIAALTERVAALEAQGGGGSAPTVTFSTEGGTNKAGAVKNTTTLQSEQIGSVDFGVSGSATAQ